MTTEQIEDESKTVTRRFGWWDLEPGQILNACEKCMGLKKGQKVNKLKQIRVVSVRKEPLSRMTIDPDYGRRECRLEGFPDMNPFEFVEMLTGHYGCSPEEIVNRIEFEYIN